jgi:outer membrane protein assembly factor BamB
VAGPALWQPQGNRSGYRRDQGGREADLPPNLAGALATAGNLVFLGHMDGTFSAYDAKTLQEVWSFNAGSGIMAPPISYAVNGKQSQCWRGRVSWKALWRVHPD